MTEGIRVVPFRRRAGLPVAAVALAALGALTPAVTFAQQTAPQAVPPPPTETASEPPPQSPPPPVERRNSGFIDAFNRWVDQSLSSLKSGLGSAGDTIGGLRQQAGDVATGVAKGAADTMSTMTKGAVEATRSASGLATGAGGLTRLGGTTVEGRERCLIAVNGAPDCRVAVEKLCRSKGFESGSSVDLQSARKCPVQVYLSGRETQPGECAIEHFVVRAMCK